MSGEVLHQFQLRFLGFTMCKQQTLYTSQWGRKLPLFVAFRSLLFFYMLVWLVIHMAFQKLEFWLYLTNWLEFLITAYLCMALAVSVYGYHQESHGVKDIGCRELGWFHSITWALFNAAYDYALVVDFLFWTILSKDAPDWFIKHPINYHLHLVNYLLLLLDLSVSAIEIRLFHWIHGLLFGTAYGLFSLLLHLTGIESSVYPIVNWKESPGMAVLVFVLVGFVGGPLAQVTAYCVFRLRTSLAKRLHVDPFSPRTVQSCASETMQITKSKVRAAVMA